jgi:flagellar M-ring protein FliF
VAVVLNNAKPPSPKTGWTPNEIANIDKILRGGLGIDANRGDVLAVSSLSFPAPAAGRAVVAGARQRGRHDRLGWIVGALFAWFAVLRPLMRMLTQRGRRKLQASAGPGPAAGRRAAGAAALAAAGAQGCRAARAAGARRHGFAGRRDAGPAAAGKL